MPLRVSIVLMRLPLGNLGIESSWWSRYVFLTLLVLTVCNGDVLSFYIRLQLRVSFQHLRSLLADSEMTEELTDLAAKMRGPDGSN